MLVGRRVKDHLRAVGVEDLLQPLLVPDGGDLHAHVQGITVFIQQVVLQFIGGVFRDIHDHQPRGPVFGDLAAQLGADGTAAACDQHGLAADEGGDTGVVQRDRLAAQQVFDLHLADGGGIAPAALRIDGGDGIAQHMDAASRSGAQLQNFPAALRRQVLDGHDDVGHRRVAQQIADLVDGAENGDAVDALVPLFGGIVNDAVRLEAAVNVVVQLAEQGGARGAAAHDGGIGLPHLGDAVDTAAVDAVNKAVGQHSQQRQRRAGQRAADPDGIHAHQQVHGGIQGKAQTHAAQQR